MMAYELYQRVWHFDGWIAWGSHDYTNCIQGIVFLCTLPLWFQYSTFIEWQLCNHRCHMENDSNGDDPAVFFIGWELSECQLGPNLDG